MNFAVPCLSPSKVFLGCSEFHNIEAAVIYRIEIISLVSLCHVESNHQFLTMKFIHSQCFHALLVQCGQGSTDDELSPKCVPSLLTVKIKGVAAGLWHTICISAEGAIYAFGGNQFGQLGIGSDQAEVNTSYLS